MNSPTNEEGNISAQNVKCEKRQETLTTGVFCEVITEETNHFE